jgi:RHS repeat-associated protein
MHHTPSNIHKNRHFTHSAYRYAFNSMERDDEVKGSGNSYTTYFRQNDPRLGKWWSIDPKPDAWQSHYTSMDNNPIRFNDPFGDDVDYGKLGDRLRVGIGRMFNKQVRSDFNERKSSDDLYVYSKNNLAKSLSSGGTVSQFGTTGGFGNTTLGVEYSSFRLIGNSGTFEFDGNMTLPIISLSWKRFQKQETENFLLDLPIDGSQVSETRTTSYPAVPNTRVIIYANNYPDNINISDENNNGIFNATVVMTGYYINDPNIDLWGTQGLKKDDFISSQSGGFLTISVTSSRQWSDKKSKSDSWVKYMRYRKIAIPQLRIVKSAVQNTKQFHFQFTGKNYNQKHNTMYDTINVYIENSSEVKNDIQDYGYLKFYKKRGGNFYIDGTKKANKKPSKKFDEHIYDYINDTICENYFIYYVNNIRIKEASRLGEFGDAGLVKLYNYDGSLKAVGVVYHLEKVGYWYYYGNNEEIEKIEFHDNTNISPTGIKYIEILGKSLAYPVLNYTIPEGVEVIKISYGS